MPATAEHAHGFHGAVLARIFCHWLRQTGKAGVIRVFFRKIGRQQVGSQDTHKVVNRLTGRAARARQHRANWFIHALVYQVQFFNQAFPQPTQQGAQMGFSFVGIFLAIFG